MLQRRPNRPTAECAADGADAVVFLHDLAARAENPDVARVMTGEQKLFELRRTARLGQKGQLKECIGQLEEEVQGLTLQANAKRREVELITRELEGLRELWKKNLVPISRVTALERDAVRIDGERGQLIASVAQARGRTAPCTSSRCIPWAESSARARR